MASRAPRLSADVIRTAGYAFFSWLVPGASRSRATARHELTRKGLRRGAVLFACRFDRQWWFQHSGPLIRRTPGRHRRAAWRCPHSDRRVRQSDRAPRASCAAWRESIVGAVVEYLVGEEAAFDEPYNIALQPSSGAPPAGRARTAPRRCIRVGPCVTHAVNFHRALARAARG